MLTRGDIRLPLYALTWWQPWGWAMFHGKPVENRGWHPPRRLVHQVVAVHAGMRYELGAFDQIQHLLHEPGGVDAPCPPKSECTLGAMIGVARLVGSLDHQDRPPILPRPPGRGPCGCQGISHRDTCPYRSPWFCGPVGWVFEDALEFPEPVPCKGHQGLWRVEGDLLNAVVDAVEAAGEVARARA